MASLARATLTPVASAKRTAPVRLAPRVARSSVKVLAQSQEKVREQDSLPCCCVLSCEM